LTQLKNSIVQHCKVDINIGEVKADLADSVARCPRSPHASAVPVLYKYGGYCLMSNE
jgi:hypothetical protein